MYLVLLFVLLLGVGLVSADSTFFEGDDDFIIMKTPGGGYVDFSEDSTNVSSLASASTGVFGLFGAFISFLSGVGFLGILLFGFLFWFLFFRDGDDAVDDDDSWGDDIGKF